MSFTEIRDKALPAGYVLKYTDVVGWWVDGRCGYLVTGYYQSREHAVETARMMIAAPRRDGERPIWLQ